jgi:hypothetical protein
VSAGCKKSCIFGCGFFLWKKLFKRRRRVKIMPSVSAVALTFILITTSVYAAEGVKKETVPAPAAPAAGEIKKEETAPAERKGKKVGKVKNIKNKSEGKNASPKPVPTEKK